MLTVLRRTATLWWQTWPWLVAIYLVGWFIRYWILQAAIAVGLDHGMLWGSLVVVFAPVARLLTYVAMFLVIRSVAPRLQHIDDTKPESGLLETVLAAILPFLVIYTAWNLIAEDYDSFATTVEYTARSTLPAERAQAILDTHGGMALWLVILVAVAGRQVFTRFRDRLPRWTLLFAVYFEVLWLFLLLQASAAAIFASPTWVAHRRIVVWLAGLRDDLFARLHFLQAWWDTVGVVGTGILTVLGISLAWLAIANTVYGSPLTPTWSGARRVLLGHRGDLAATRAIEQGKRAMHPRWQRVPRTVQSRVSEFARAQLGRFGPIVDAARLILHGGAVPIAFFVLVYTVLVLLAPSGVYYEQTVTDGYLWRGIATLLGPHDWGWWQAYADTLRVVIGALVDPIRICLVAATYWYCVDQVREHAAVQPSAGLELEHRP